MSVVSGVVLCTSSAEDLSSPNGLPILFENIQEWLAERAPFQQLNSVEDSFGGSKHPQMFVAGGGFNHFPEDDFAAYVMLLPWQNPENVVLVIDPEEGPTRVFRPSCL
ncbi:hypothetical protein NKH16_08185 [Mesorhizobium sp. M1307]|uniref:hypothetical protein n=1 Tax=Mesorhizobium sp. M1307 TaxID=2957079 RepID=UPI003338580A